MSRFVLYVFKHLCMYVFFYVWTWLCMYVEIYLFYLTIYLRVYALISPEE